MQGVVGDDSNGVAAIVRNDQDSHLRINRAGGPQRIRILRARVHPRRAVLHVVPPIEHLRRTRPATEAQPRRLHPILRQLDGVPDPQRRALAVPLIRVRSQQTGGRRPGMRVGGGDEDVVRRYPRQLRRARLRLVALLLRQHDHVADAEGDRRVAVLQHHRLRVQRIVNVLGAPLREEPRHLGPQKRRGDLSRYRRKLWLTEAQCQGPQIARVAVPQLFRDTPAGRGLWQLGCAFSFAVRSLTVSKPEVLLLYSPPLPLGLSAWGLRQLWGTPFVLNVQDLFPQSAIDLGILKSGFLIRLFERLERFIYQHADCITVHSSGNRDHVLRRGATPERVTVMHNWVDCDFIQPGERLNGFSKEHGLDDKFVVSFAGVLGYSQDIDLILDAAHLLREIPDICFLVVGDGVEKNRLVQKAQGMKLLNVKFLAMQPRHRYPAILHASDVSLATLHAEVATPVVPSKILSIMAAGRPVIACLDLSGDAPRLINEAQCGYVLPPEDAQSLSETILLIFDFTKRTPAFWARV